jgi:serine/threonine protein kinase
MKIREYEIIDKIGQPGGMAVVYKAKHQSLEVIRAIKKLHFHLTSNASIIQRFENEAKALSILEHPNIVKVYDFFREEDSYYLIMEYVDGLSLAEVLANSALGEKLALEYIKQILSTMAFAHSKKILHRDIKPSNILIDSKGNVKVVDFGIAKMMDRKGLTSAGFTMGSPWYMSPEQIEGHDLDERSDIYSLGITLFEMLTARVPFDDTSEYKIYEKHQKEPVPSLKDINKNLSVDLDAIIQKASAKNINDRFQRAEDFAEAVDIYLALSQISKGAGTTIADFDPAEYIKSQKSKTAPKIDLNLPTKFMQLTSIGPVQEPTDKKTEVKDTRPELVQKKTTIQKATIFQDTGEEQEPQTISDLVEKKKIKGLPTARKKILSKNMLLAVGGVSVILIFLFLYFMIDTTPDMITIEQGRISYDLIKINWPEKSNSEYYQISKKAQNASDFQLLAKSSTTVFEDTSVLPGENYVYQITAHEQDGSIIAMGEILVQTPKIEFGLAADEVSDTWVSLVWNQLENIQNYILFRKDKESKSPDDLKEVYRGNETEYYDKKLKPEYNYSYLLKVKFIDQKVYESSYLEVTTAEKTESAVTFGELRINSTPDDAKIFMNGRELGKTPFRRKGLKSGSYKITIKKEGYSDFTKRVRIKANKITKFSPELVSLSGKLAIKVKPFGSILVDGKLLKRDTPTQFTTDILAGKHKVTVVHAGLSARWEKMINVSGGKTQNILVDFTKMVNITVVSKPGGTIIVDGKSTGEATPKQIKVRVGQHIIGVRREGFEMEGGSKNINVDADLKEPLEFVLREKK